MSCASCANNDMGFIGRYIAYLKDNPHGYWFKRKLYGWGWVPARREGWLVIAAYVALFAVGEVRVIRRVEIYTLTTQNVIFFAAYASVITLILIRICYTKGEKPKWMWGVRKKIGQE